MTAASEYGTFRLTYTPPEATGQEDYPLITIEMSTSGDASVDQMLRFYEAFLAASGFSLRGDLQVVEPERDLWSATATDPRATNFVPFSQFGDNVFTLGDK